MTSDLGNINRSIQRGELGQARQALATVLRADPHNVEAWALLATLFDDPTRQADCYHQVLRIDPGNRDAAKRLRALTASEGEPLVCAQCGGPMDVGFFGELRDKRAGCPYCGNQVNLPDSYQRVRKKQAHERRPWGTRTEKETVIETRRDGLYTDVPVEELPPALREVLKRLATEGPGALDENTRQRLKEQGIELSFDPSSFDEEALQTLKGRGFSIRSSPPGSTSSEVVFSVRAGQREDSLLAGFFRQGDEPGQETDVLDPEETIRLAGGAIPEEERWKCPNPKCGAVIPKDASKCSWCGASL